MVGVKYSNLKSVPRYVATFGNSDTTKPGDWVKNLFTILDGDLKFKSIKI